MMTRLLSVALALLLDGVTAVPAAPSADPGAADRARMVEEQLVARGIEDDRVLEAMGRVPRHELVPERERSHAYDDSPLPIGEGQTISQPYVVAYMTEQLRLRGDERVLEVGTGSGYQAAILGELAAEVYTIEIVPSLARRAAKDLARLGYENVHVREGDGFRGWPERAPFNAVIVTAAPERIPQPLLDQLAPGGRMILPLGDRSQRLVLVTRTGTGFEEEELLPVRFVPMTGEVREPPPELGGADGAAFDRALSYYPRFQAWAALEDPGWVLFELMTKLRDVDQVAALDFETYRARLRDDPGFAELVAILIDVYEHNCVVTGHVSDGLTGEEVGGVVLSFDTGSQTVRTSSSNLGEFRLVYPCDGEEAEVSTRHHAYLTAHRRIRLGGRVVSGAALVVFPALRSYRLAGTLPEAEHIQRTEVRGDWGARYCDSHCTPEEDGLAGFTMQVIGPPGGKVELRLFSEEAEYRGTAVLNEEPVSVTLEMKERDPGGGREEGAALVRSESDPRMSTRNSGACRDRSFALTLDGTRFPPRIERCDPYGSLEVHLGWSTGGAEPDSGVVVVELRCPGSAPQVQYVPRGGRGTERIGFGLEAPKAGFASGPGDIVVTARTLVSCPDGDEGEYEVTLSQEYEPERP
jgi:protein-L-isoaspartate(D-aspartate) O-methyltransferase